MSTREEDSACDPGSAMETQEMTNEYAQESQQTGKVDSVQHSPGWSEWLWHILGGGKIYVMWL